MSDAAPPVQLANSFVDGSHGGALSSDAIDRVLGEFRVWLTELSSLPAPTEEPPAVDLHTLVAQFTALRHEINLQTKATRSTLEQNGEVLSELRSTVEQLQEQPNDDGLDPLLKALVDVYDNLALALRQVEKQREAVELPLKVLTEGLVSSPKAGFWSSLFGGSKDRDNSDQQKSVAEAGALVRSSLDSVIAGYRMSLARVERILEQSDLETIASVGQTFDPELMEVVEVVGETGRPAGEVVEEVRRGYLRGEVVFRYAQVKVAR
jgi:molecular chaperone GrpE